jgi:hypothetical protein
MVTKPNHRTIHPNNFARTVEVNNGFIQTWCKTHKNVCACGVLAFDGFIKQLSGLHRNSDLPVVNGRSRPRWMINYQWLTLWPQPGPSGCRWKFTTISVICDNLVTRNPLTFRGRQRRTGQRQPRGKFIAAWKT